LNEMSGYSIVISNVMPYRLLLKEASDVLEEPTVTIFNVKFGKYTVALFRITYCPKCMAVLGINKKLSLTVLCYKEIYIVK